MQVKYITTVCKCRRSKKGTLQAKIVTIDWKIERFFADCHNNGDCYQSSSFSIPDCDEQKANWCLQVYPKGPCEDSKENVSLFLYFSSFCYCKVPLYLKLSIACTRCDKVDLVEMTKATLTGEADSIGWEDFVKQDFIKDVKNGFLVGDTLTIRCEIKFGPMIKRCQGYDEYLHKIDDHRCKYEKIFENCREKDNFSDVTFVVQGNRLYLHKAIILTCDSPYFKAMFQQDMKEKNQSTVDITDIDYQVMREVFRFIYTGRVEDIDKIAKDLLIAADRFSMMELKALCEKTLYDNITSLQCHSLYEFG